MTEKRDLRVEVRGDQIIVSLPAHCMTYCELFPALAGNNPDKEDRYAPIKLTDFLPKAWKLANAKAHELVVIPRFKARG